MAISRRQFLSRVPAVAALPAWCRGDLRAAGELAGTITARTALGFADPSRQRRGDSSVAAALRAGGFRAPERRVPGSPGKFDWEGIGAGLRRRFRDLRRHFVFEYYPWYGKNPWRHWNDADRFPPVDLASNYVPLLGAYDSRDPAVLECHARWIAESGVGAVNLSWWGRGSTEDRAVPLLMDVMRAHDIHVTFHLEPYGDNRAATYKNDILYLLREYGDKRKWDCFLLLEGADGRTGPVFKSFRTILPRTVADCHGVAYPVPDYTADGEWRRITDSVREELRGDFDRVTLLADSLDFGRTPASGFDGIAVYDNYVEPHAWPGYAEECGRRGLVFSFNVNPGFDAVVQRHVEPGSCYEPPRFLPAPHSPDWSSALSRTGAARLAAARIRESFETTVGLQADPLSGNSSRGFFLTYVNSFNEWHEGDQFEPMKNLTDLRPLERAMGYHNALLGGYRLDVLRGCLKRLLG